MNRLEWVLGILLVVLLLVVVGISAFLWLQPRTATLPEGYEQTTVVARPAGAVAPTSVYEGKTALVGYAAAQGAISDWHDDAALLNANATWPMGTSEADLRNGDTTWGFTFFSPSAGKAALVTVTGDLAQRISESSYAPPVPPADVGGWQLDSRAAVERMLDEGGSDFLQSAGATTMVMQLTTGNENGRIEWFMSLISENGRSLNMRIDATSGEILEVSEA